MTDVSIIWWAHQTMGENARWNVQCFESVDCRVEITNTPSPFSDLIFTAIPGVKSSMSMSLVTQLSGFGQNLIRPGKGANPNLSKTFENSDVVTVIDPNFLYEMERVGVNEEVKLIPNPAPPVTILDSSEGKERFGVLCPQGDGWVKKPDRLIEVIRRVGEEEPDIDFVIPSKVAKWRNPIDWLELDNLTVLPHQSFEKMMRLYSWADMVLHFSFAEILSWTITETFLAGKPLVAKNMGRIQTINRDLIPEMCDDLGMDCSEFDERWRGEYVSGDGDHYIGVNSIEGAVEAVLELYSDRKGGLEIGDHALDWISVYWQPEDKGRAILEVAGIA